MAAVSALAGVVTINYFCEDHIIPEALDKNVVPIVTKAVANASF
jgi:malate dehydrogenase (oxaloacetate-decarboxylating)